ncbi:MAG: hypothetical protein FJY91_01880 [Candidatus Harrisonbacteria bacterium]|nr:hypothetical protein [Candidatus Harrisonbacteria bacterium]
MSFSLKPEHVSVAIEGPDGAGKATQSPLLCHWLKGQLGGGIEVCMVDMPRYPTSIGQIIKGMLTGTFGIKVITFGGRVGNSLFLLQKGSCRSSFFIFR